MGQLCSKLFPISHSLRYFAGTSEDTRYHKCGQDRKCVHDSRREDNVSRHGSYESEHVMKTTASGSDGVRSSGEVSSGQKPYSCEDCGKTFAQKVQRDSPQKGAFWREDSYVWRMWEILFSTGLLSSSQTDTFRWKASHMWWMWEIVFYNGTT